MARRVDLTTADGRSGGAWCRWRAMFLRRLDPPLDRLQHSLRPGGPQLQAGGLGSEAEQSARAAGLAEARRRPSLWPSPALMEMVWELPQAKEAGARLAGQGAQA